MSSSPPVLSSHPLLFVRFCLPPPMPSLSRRSASPLQSEGTGEFNSNSFWTDCSAISTLQEGSPLFEGLPMIFEANNLPTIPIDNFPPSDRGPPPVPPEDFESVKATIGYNIPFGIQPEDLCVIPLQSLTTANHNSTPPCSLNPIHQTAVQYGLSTLSTATDGLACTHLVSAPVYPWAPAAYLQFLNNNPQTPPPPYNESIATVPANLSISPFFCNGSGSEEDADYAPPSEFEETTAPSRTVGCFHTYRRSVPRHNLQCEDVALFFNKVFGSRCPVPGCDNSKVDWRTPDLKRHIETHGGWIEPDKWTCCGVGVDRIHLYRKDLKQGMSEEELVNAGAYEFKGRLMIGGCMGTFSRKDSLKRHIDNDNNLCIGDMRFYYY